MKKPLFSLNTSSENNNFYAYSSLKRFAISLLLTALYLILMILLGGIYPDAMLPLAFIPILFWAYLFGRVGGGISGLVGIPVMMYFYRFLGWQEYYEILSRFPTIFNLVFAFWGYILGDLQETRRRLEFELSTRRQAEQSLKDKELRYRSLFEHGNDAVFIMDMNYFNLAVNQRACEMLGYENDELIGMHASKMVAPEEWGEAISKLAALTAGNELPIYERTYIAKDGSRIKCEVNIALISEKDGTPKHFQNVVRDVTERSKTEEQIRLQAAVLEAAAPGILITDRDGIIIWSNPAFTRLSGFSAREILGKTPSIFKSGKHDEDFYQQIWQTIKSGNAWRGRIVNKRKNGEQYNEEMVITPVRGEKEEIVQYVAIKQDVSLQVKAEEQLEHLALHDSLTNLPNRILFYERFEQMSAISYRNKQKCAILFIDLDNFKQVNDNFGHENGDILLRNIAERLSQLMRASDTVARIGGDEFGVSLVNVTSEGIQTVVDKILHSLKQDFILKNEVIKISASIGISVFPDHGVELNHLLGLADRAMYFAKDHGKNTYCLYTENLGKAGLTSSMKYKKRAKGSNFDSFFRRY